MKNLDKCANVPMT